MTDLLDTPEGREAVQAMMRTPPMDGWERPEAEVALRAALPALERGFRKQMAEELEKQADTSLWMRKDGEKGYREAIADLRRAL